MLANLKWDVASRRRRPAELNPYAPKSPVWVAGKRYVLPEPEVKAGEEE
jgi:hypothetical protein